MAVVRGVKEKVHLPLYDAKLFEFVVNKKVVDHFNGNNVLRFFVDVQGKSKLETNQQESGVLSHFNTYEARALRVVVQPLTGDAGGDNQYDTDNFLKNFIYNSVTTLVVGEKIMIQAPTWTFPSGAGESNTGSLSNGEPSPEATFRFAEPVTIDSQQNFRVEIEFPQGVSNALGKATVPETQKQSRVWVMIDGYLTRDVQ